MIIHQAESMHSMAESLYPLLNKKEQSVTILWGKEYILPTITSKHDMVQSARNMNPWFACHNMIIDNFQLNNSITHA